MKADRFFYTATAGLFLLLMLLGFRPFYTHGTGFAGRIIDPGILPLVTVHGVAIALWFVLFFVQSLLIGVRRRKIHMKLGWSAVGIGVTIACTGTAVAIRSVQMAPQTFFFFGMQYSRFLLVMLTEMALFAAFLLAGMLTRKKPKIHRPMMLLAGLSIIAGATVRIPWLIAVFGMNGWIGLFGAVFCLGALLLLVRSALARSFDRWLAAGYAFWVLAFIASTDLALTDTWTRVATRILAI